MTWKVAHACVRGSSHLRSGQPNQDAVQSAAGPEVTVVAVSDGHGSARHFRSQVGSALAVSTALGVVQPFLARLAASAAPLVPAEVEQLQRALVEAWTASVWNDLRHQPLRDDELARLEMEGIETRLAVEQQPTLAYGATLLVAAATRDLVLYLQLGDGEILSVGADGETVRPLDRDDRLVGNQTTSLCQPEAWREFRSAWSAAPGLPALVLLSTDGYANSFRSDEDFLKIGGDYLEILREQGIASLADELPAILEEATRQGSGDDITLAILQGDLRRPGEDRAPLRPAISDQARSALVAQLKSRHSSQTRQLGELESRLAQSSRSNARLRLVLAGAALVLIAAGAYLVRDQIHWPHPADTPIGKPALAPPGGKPGPAAHAPAVAGPARWRLQVPDADPITLAKGRQLLASEIFPDGPDKLYARVAQQDGQMILINDSKDTWKVKPAGAAAFTVAAGASIPLGKAALAVTFAKGVTGKIVAIDRSAAPSHPDALPTPPLSPAVQPTPGLSS